MKDRFTDIVLDNVFPAGYRLVMDKSIRSLILMKGNAFHEQVCFTPHEYSFIMLLCEAFPRGCRYETLLAYLKGIEEADALRILRDAMHQRGNTGYDRELRGVRNIISKLRAQLLLLSVSLDINSQESFYVLAKPGQRLSLQERLRAEIEDEQQDERSRIRSMYA